MNPPSSPRDMVRSTTIAPALSRWRTTSCWSALTNTSMGTSFGALALSTVGRSMTAGVTRGAVTMKITSSTSMTSTYGTMLISLIVPRRRRTAGIALPHGLAVEDVRKLFHEALETVGEPVDVVRVAVVGHHRRNRAEQADGGRPPGPGKARRDLSAPSPLPV